MMATTGARHGGCTRDLHTVPRRATGVTGAVPTTRQDAAPRSSRHRNSLKSRSPPFDEEPHLLGLGDR